MKNITTYENSKIKINKELLSTIIDNKYTEEINISKQNSKKYSDFLFY